MRKFGESMRQLSKTFSDEGEQLLDPDETPEDFGVSLSQLRHLAENKNKQELQEFGGLSGLEEALRTSTSSGIDTQGAANLSANNRQKHFGANKFKDVPQKAFFTLFWENLKDPTLILLMAAALVSTVLGVTIKEQREEKAWTEGVAIWVAVLVVSLVGAGNDYQKDKQFKKLNAQKDKLEVKVIRDGEQILVENTEVVVGDLLLLDTGDKIVADGIVAKSFHLVVDEAALTGESEPLPKGEDDMWCMSGSEVTEGSGSVLVTAVGENSEWGKTMALVRSESADTPLQGSLASLAAAIGKLGLAVGVLCFIVLTVRWMIENRGFPVNKIVEGPLNFFIFAVTIVVVAVPEGLPLAVTISLAYSLRKMMIDNNFVRVLAACETMGGATAICSDKTGTLTENRMTVVEGWFAGKSYKGKVPDMLDLPEAVRPHLELNIAMNSKAFLIEKDDGSIDMVGNRTEGALLMLLRGWGRNYKTVRANRHEDVAQLYGFSSAKKMASVMLKTDSGLRLYNKGAAEMVLDRCTRYIETDGSTVELSDEKKKELGDMISSMADKGLRTLCLSYRDYRTDSGDEPPEESPDEDLTACCVVGIKDPVRKEVPEAVATCHRAGILVRMVTGDNIHTARHIAKECGILTEGGIALEGPEFRELPEEEMLKLLPRLQVLARSSPNDKYDLVKLLKKNGEVVAVTGDGTNDAPALKESDVGLAMGIAGTEVAKEAADIVILDDNFSSIVKSVSWGRCVFANLRKFLQFQLTINLVALVVAFVAAVTTGEMPLNVLQLLWVNLIMDALAALALATEDPSPDLLLETPHGRTEPLINGAMWTHIMVQGIYQVFWLMLIFYGAPARLPAYDTTPSACPTYTLVNMTWAPPFSLQTDIPVPNPSGVDLCCVPGSLEDPCLVQDGGVYLEGETPLCSVNGDGECSIGAPQSGEYCSGYDNSTDCPRFRDFEALYMRGEQQLAQRKAEATAATNSLVFNAFIWLQIFNMLNARKIKHEFNIFAGLWRSRAFLYVFTIIVSLQLIIMLTPVASFFSVTKQAGSEWLFALVLGFGSLLVSVATKAVVRSLVCGGWCPPKIKFAQGGSFHEEQSGETEMTAADRGSPSLHHQAHSFSKHYRSVPNRDMDQQHQSNEGSPHEPADMEKAFSGSS
ncbi:hypothetical protein WJX82_010215 [Trebouxia sp. C0006]